MRIDDSTIDITMASNPERIVIQDAATGGNWAIPIDEVPSVLGSVMDAWRNHSAGLQSKDGVVRLPIDILCDVGVILGFYLGVKTEYDESTIVPLDRFTVIANIPRRGRIQAGGIIRP